ncbi:SOSS complex subunit C-like isoform X1 [Solea solea]|uniref:SOSS complex subunit C-like isoform X1 n=1 Tax=Solea solea TaxID=90069 RepID=UPI00272AE4B6|nr:SOSS complex subunit C-like isoform X1 [Solea solea]
MAANPPGQAFPNKARVAILAELEKERRRLLQNPSLNTPGARLGLKDFRDNAEQQHIAAQQKAALQVTNTHRNEARANTLLRLLHHSGLVLWKPHPPCSPTPGT